MVKRFTNAAKDERNRIRSPVGSEFLFVCSTISSSSQAREWIEGNGRNGKAVTPFLTVLLK